MSWPQDILNRLSQPMHFRVRCSLIACVLLFSPTLQAGEFIVKEASAQLSENQLQSQALFDLKFNNTVSEALHNGIPITLTTRLSLSRKRRGVWNKKIATWQQEHIISYHSLSDRYQLNCTHIEGTQSYASIREVLDQIENYSLTSDIVPQTMPNSSRGYELKLVIRLAIKALPPALRIVAYVSPSWRIKGPTRVWSIPKPLNKP